MPPDFPPYPPSSAPLDPNQASQQEQRLKGNLPHGLIRPLGDLLAWVTTMVTLLGATGILALGLKALDLPTVPALILMLVALLYLSPARLLRQLIWDIPLRAKAASNSRHVLLSMADLASALAAFALGMAMGEPKAGAAPFHWGLVESLEALILLTAAFLYSPVRFTRKLVWNIPLRAKGRTVGRQKLLMGSDILFVVLFLGLGVYSVLTAHAPL